LQLDRSWIRITAISCTSCDKGTSNPKTDPGFCGAAAAWIGFEVERRCFIFVKHMCVVCREREKSKKKQNNRKTETTCKKEGEMLLYIYIIIIYIYT
jgi:hypothetical protein